VRSRGPSGRRFFGGSYWLIVAASAAVIITSGYALGAFIIGSFGSSPPQSSAQGTPTAPPGLTYVLAEAQVVNATNLPAQGSCTTSNLGSLATPTLLTNGAKTGICLNTAVAGFTSGDLMYVFSVSWGTSAAVSTIFEIQVGVDVTPSTNDVVATSYLETSATITVSEGAVFGLDLTAAGDTGVVSYSILVTQL
jgi:hypothetical protein